MPGQCYGCAVEFGVFKKEHGCKNCGYAFCSKCLHSKTIRVPKRNNEKHHVCDKCYRMLSGAIQAEDKQTKYELPQAYIKRVEALKDREGQTSTSSDKKGHVADKVPAHIRGLVKPDREIAMRLERLKDSDKPKEKITNDAISARLANLQGQPHRPDQKPVYRPPDRRLQGQQVDDLLEEIAAEIEIDSRTDPAKDIERRLENLRQGDKKQEPDGNNLNKESASKKDKDYNKNIGNYGEASGSKDEIDIEEMQKLMEKAAVELEMDAKKAVSDMQKDEELMDRLKEIQKRREEKDSNNKDGATSTDENSEDFNESDDDSEEEDDDKAAAKIIQRYLEESKIDDQVMKLQGAAGDEDASRSKRRGAHQKSKKEENMDSPNIKPLSKRDLEDDDEYEDKSELPFCCICTEDAVVRCKDCDMDLYCQRCFRECHREMDVDDHRTIPYKTPKGYH